MVAAAPLMIGATALKAGGALVKGIGISKANNYNAKVSELKADDELRVGAAQEAQVRSAARRQIGTQVANQAESGFTVGAGSALTGLEESLINRELDLLNIRRGAIGRANGLRQDAVLSRYEGKNAKTTAFLDAATIIADSAAKAARAGGG